MISDNGKLVTKQVLSQLLHSGSNRKQFSDVSGRIEKLRTERFAKESNRVPLLG